MKIKMRRDFNGLKAGREYDMPESDVQTLLVARVADRVDESIRAQGESIHGRVPSPINRDEYQVVPVAGPS